MCVVAAGSRRVGGGANSGSNQSLGGSSSSWTGRNKMMPPDEAYKVLNVDPKSSVNPHQEIQDNFKKLFTINDVTQGGSFYLQSKVYRAKQTLDRIHKPTTAKPSASSSSSSTSASKSASAS